MQSRLHEKGISFEYREIPLNNGNLCHVFSFHEDVKLCTLVELLKDIQVQAVNYNSEKRYFIYLEKRGRDWGSEGYIGIPDEVVRYAENVLV